MNLIPKVPTPNPSGIPNKLKLPLAMKVPTQIPNQIKLPVQIPTVKGTILNAVPTVKGTILDPTVKKIDVPSKVSVKETILQRALDMKDATRDAINHINPMSYATKASTFMENKTHLDGAVRYANIIHLVFYLLSRIFWILSTVISWVIFIVAIIIGIIIALVIFILPFLPILLFIMIICAISQVLWDDITVPIIEGFIDLYNGVINAWNDITGVFNNLGIDFRILGKNIHIPLLNLNLPQGDTISANISQFWPFIQNIFENVLYYSIVLPMIEFIKSMTQGTIFR
jgi:hypothetical protein